MYVQITRKCNMTCAHCGFACTNRGRHMPFDTFKAAIDCNDGAVTLGGGEPTLHPDFEKMLFYALANVDFVTVITNGSITDTALALARMANDECFCAQLSQDEYHDPIDERVVRAYERMGGTRNTTRYHQPVREGRCTWGVEGCICNGDPFVRTNGIVYQCGCARSIKVGDVFNGFEGLDEEWICCEVSPSLKA